MPLLELERIGLDAPPTSAGPRDTDDDDDDDDKDVILTD
jgi:hypothetical protein